MLQGLISSRLMSCDVPKCLHSSVILLRNISLILLMTIHLPTIISSLLLASFRILAQMSMVKRVLLLLKMDASELMRAANITASIKPRSPVQGSQANLN